MLKFLELLNHLERQIAAGRQLVDLARVIPEADQAELDRLEDDMDALDLRIVDVVDDDVDMREINELERLSSDLYKRLLVVGQVITNQ